MSDDRAVTGRGRRRLVVVVLAALSILAFSVLLVVGLALTDTDRVSTAADQRNVDIGRPLAWVHQDQSGSTPPLPTDLALSSPWEAPTGVAGVALLVDVLIVSALTVVVVGGLWAGGRAFGRHAAPRGAQPGR